MRSSWSNLLRLRSENVGLRELSQERQAQLAAALERAEAAERELTAITGTARWRLADRVGRVANRLLPPGTRRRALIARRGPAAPPPR